RHAIFWTDTWDDASRVVLGRVRAIYIPPNSRRTPPCIALMLLRRLNSSLLGVPPACSLFHSSDIRTARTSQQAALTAMKIFSFSVLQTPSSGPTTLLTAANDLSSIPFYQKGSAGELMSFFSKTVAERTPPEQRQSIQENAYTAHIFNRGGGLSTVIITDEEYPVRPAFSLLNKVLDEFEAQVPQAAWATPEGISFPELATYLAKC
ncbi:Longin-like domain-containing protein, partial [Mycena rosella]